jgi:hypothetical protein
VGLLVLNRDLLASELLDHASAWCPTRVPARARYVEQGAATADILSECATTRCFSSTGHGDCVAAKTAAGQCSPLSLLAYNVGRSSLTVVQQRLVKTGGRLSCEARPVLITAAERCCRCRFIPSCRRARLSTYAARSPPFSATRRRGGRACRSAEVQISTRCRAD